MMPSSLRAFILINLVVGVGLAIWLGASGFLWLALMDVAGLIGLSLHAWRALDQARGEVALLDLWAAYPLITWAAWVVFA